MGNSKDEEMLKILERFKRGVCTSDENMRIIKWYNSLGKDSNVYLDEDTANMIRQKLWTEITNNIDSREVVFKKRKYLYSNIYFKMAASAAMICVLIYAVSEFVDKKFTVGPQALDSRKSELLQKISNTSNNVREVLLQDSTVVYLQPNTTIRFNNLESNPQRIVELEGEAFFDVSHDSKRPFTVYTGDIVTKVLGTSFTIRRASINDEIVISVRSGRVSVSKVESESMNDVKNEVILTTNQQIKYNIKNDEFITSLVDHPVILRDKESGKSIRFDEESVSVILQSLEKLYGVEIEFNEDMLNACKVTIMFSDEDLFERLTLISKIMGGSYAVSGTNIIFSSKDCKPNLNE